MAILPSRHDTKQPGGEAPHPPKLSVVLTLAASMPTLLASFPVARLQQLAGDHTALHTAILPHAFERTCHLAQTCNQADSPHLGNCLMPLTVT